MGFFDRLMGKECECNKGKKRKKGKRRRRPSTSDLRDLRDDLRDQVRTREQELEWFANAGANVPEAWGTLPRLLWQKCAEIEAHLLDEAKQTLSELEKQLGERTERDEPIACQWASEYGIESHDVFWAIAAAYNEGVLSDHDERYLQQVLDGYALLHPEVLDQARYDLIVFGWGTVEDMQKAAAVLGLTSGSRSSMRHDGKGWRIQGLVPLAQVEPLRVSLHALHEAGKLRENPLPVLVFWGYDVPADAEPADLAKLLEERKAATAAPDVVASGA